MKKVGIIVSAVAVVLSFFIYLKFNIASNANTTQASSQSSSLTTEGDWNQGTKANVDSSTSPGDLKVDLTSVTIDGGILSSSGDVTGDLYNIFDGNENTGIDVGLGNINWDLEGSFLVSKIRYRCGTQDINAQFSMCTYPYYGTNPMIHCGPTFGLPDWAYTLSGLQGTLTPNDWTEYSLGNVRMSQAKSINGGVGWPIDLREWQLIGVPSEATHTSATTQITDTNLYQWQTFSPTYTEPANTDISFKFRTSTDSTNWTAWTASQTVASGGSLDMTGLVTSSTGAPGSETFYKYIQVETTLVSTDGIATPTLSDYTIGYHTNVAPDAPTPGSVTIGI